MGCSADCDRHAFNLKRHACDARISAGCERPAWARVDIRGRALVPGTALARFGLVRARVGPHPDHRRGSRPVLVLRALH